MEILEIGFRDGPSLEEGAGCEIVLHPENKLFHVDSLYWQRSLDSV